MKNMDILFNYAKTQNLNPTRRPDGSFFVQNLKSRDELSVIPARFNEDRFETWDYRTRFTRDHRNLESVKRSLRRIRARNT